MNISKTIATEIADKMIVPMVKNHKEQQQKLEDYCTLIMSNQIPVPVLKAFKEYREYFDRVNTIYLYNGSAQICVYTNKGVDIPEKFNGQYSCTNEQFDFISKLKQDLKQLEDEKRRVKESIIETLLSLRTTKRAIKEFPDAAPYLQEYDDGKVTALSLPIKTISDVLNKYKK